MNRRNVLLGLGAIATGGGALFGSGAFSSVQANREVTIGVTDDASAYLTMTVNDSSVANSSGGAGNEIAINANQFNADATTVFKSAFDITHTAGGPREIAIGNPSVSFGTVNFIAYDEVNDTIGTDVNLSNGYVTLSSGADLVVGIEAVINETANTSESTTVTVEAAADAADLTVTTNDSTQDETA